MVNIFLQNVKGIDLGAFIDHVTGYFPFTCPNVKGYGPWAETFFDDLLDGLFVCHEYDIYIKA